MYVAIPKDLSKIKSKVAFGLTARQLVCFLIAGAIGIPVFFAVRGLLGNSLAALAMIAAMVPVLLFAFYEHHGQPMEAVVQHFIQARFIRPRQRPYQTDNAYSALMRQAQLNREVKEIVSKTSSRQKRQSKTGAASDSQAAKTDRRRGPQRKTG